MGIENKVADVKSKEKDIELSEFSKKRNSSIDRKANSNTKSTKKNRRKHSRKIFSSPVQKLFGTCMEVFANCQPGVVPSPENIDKLRSVLDDMKPSDVGLTQDMPYFKKPTTHKVPAITYLHLHECDKFSMGIFCLPPSGVIPLHNHPGMTVFSKLLFGTMHIKSYDWVADASCNTDVAANSVKSTNPGIRLAKLKVDSDFTAPCSTSILYPADGGNMHCFTAVTACAVLDVLGPPYSDPDGRHCAYYLEHPFSSFPVDEISIPEDDEKEGNAWLEERDKPEDFSVVGALYKGPKIREMSKVA